MNNLFGKNGVKAIKGMKIGKKHFDYITTIDTLHGLKLWMQENQNNPQSHKQRSCTRDNGNGWHGTDSIQEWYDVMQKGDKKVMKVIKEAKEKTDKKLMNTVISGYRFDVEGLFFDIGKVLSGEPECWLKPLKEDEPQEIILKISTSANEDISAERIAQGAGEILGIVNKLEQDGFRVKLENWLFSERVTKNGAYNHLTIVTVKDFNDTINYAKMSAIVSPSLQRRGVFMLREQMLGQRMARGYGRTERLEGVTTVYDKPAMRKLTRELFEKKD